MNYYRFERKEMVDFLPSQYSRVLEIGCGQGTFRKYLDAKAECWGVELTPEAAKHAERVFDKVLQGTYSESCDMIPDSNFDLIICNDVIEHMPDEKWFLHSIGSKLSPNGVLVGSVPNVRQLFNLLKLIMLKDWEYIEAGILDRTHLRFFTKKSLIRTFEECGYGIEIISGINSIASSVNPIRNVAKKIFYAFPLFVFGLDTQFSQFGFRIKLRNRSQ